MTDKASIDAPKSKKKRSSEDKHDRHHKKHKSKKHAEDENGSEKVDQLTNSDSTKEKKKKKKKKRKHRDEDGTSSNKDDDAKAEDQENPNDSVKRKKKKRKHKKDSTERTNTSEGKANEEEEVADKDHNEENNIASSSTLIDEKKGKGGVQDRLDVMLAGLAPDSSSTKLHRGTSSGRTSGGGGNRKVDKEYFLLTLDPTLTHEDMLVKELFYYNQLRWLEEERGLKIRKGPFDKREDKIIKDTLEEFKQKNGMDNEVFVDFVLKGRQDTKEADQYALLWQDITRRLTGRPNRSVRTHVRRDLRNFVHKVGPWTDEEQHLLEDAVKEHGMAWKQISDILNRSAEHCRLRWRDYKGDGMLQRQKGKWAPVEDEMLTEAVKGMDEDPNEVEVTQAFWDEICTKLKGARSGRQCELRWKILNPKNGNAICYKQDRDGPILLKRLNDQAASSQNDNFNDVDLVKLLRGRPNWSVKIIKRAWRTMVEKYAVEDKKDLKDPYSDFRARLAKITEAMKKEEDPDWKAYADPEKKRKKKDPNQKKKKQPVIVKKQDDLIDSDNEINALIPQSTESQTSTSKNAEKIIKKQAKGSKKSIKTTEDRNDSDDSIG